MPRSRGRDLRIKIEPEHLGEADSSPSCLEKAPVEKKQEKKQFEFNLPSNLQWIPANWNWPKVKPVIRCAVAAWISTVLFVLPAVERFMGQVSSAFMSPPSDPFMAVLEREILIITLVSTSWAWSCLGIKLASLARAKIIPNATFASAVTGQYIEAAPTVIIAVFIFFGSVFFLYIRVRQGPGPYLFACILSCICLDITLTTSVLFPYPYYRIGQAVLIPLAFHSCIALLTSIVVFPQTVSAQFTTRLQGVLTPLIKSLELHRSLKDLPPNSPEFASASQSIKAAVNQAEGGLIPLAVSARLLPSDLIYARFAPTDFKALQAIARRMAVRANGLTIYFSLIDPMRERFPATPGPSRPGTPGTMTPVRPSRQSSPERGSRETDTEDGAEPITEPGTPTGSIFTRRSPDPSRTHSRSRSHHHHHHGFHNLLRDSLLHLTLPRVQKNEQAVGVFESHRYMDLEATLFHDPATDAYTQRTTELLLQSADELLDGCRGAVTAVSDWLGTVRRGRLAFWVGKSEKKRRKEVKLEELQQLRDSLGASLELYQSKKRHAVLEPFRPVFEGNGEQEVPSHRYLFHCYVYQYHLMRFSTQIVEMLDEIIRLEKARPENRIWTPVQKIFSWSNWNLSDVHDDEEDPETVQGLEPAIMNDLGIARKRDPDRLPPHNAFEWAINKIYGFVTGLGGGNVLYAIKAGIFTIILCLPGFLTSSAQFAYSNRFVWGVIMGQVTLARFRGDTTFGLVARIISTFFGGLAGAVIWYISTGNGHGNAYGLAAVLGFCFPFFFYARLYWPVPPMTNIIFFVTTMLVVGYSYQDTVLLLPANPGYGINVAWRRFVLVTAGVTAAFLFSFLPPSTTIRRYQRTTLATTSSELGAIYCCIVSYASTRRYADSQQVITSLIAIRSKLNRSAVLKTNVIYEYSLRGRWPAQRYHKILELQLQTAYCLSHLMSVISHMDPAWTRAFLARTRFLDPNFQGDVLAVISMIATSLCTGEPLPQITPCPLLDRFMLKFHGFSVIHKEAEEDFGLPRTLTMETLQNEQYLMFSVGVSTAFGIVSRLDRLMVAVKEIVGEQYHVHGVSTMLMKSGVEMGSRTNTLQMRSPV
ncbi:uncharacterized protein BT62DRAFT_910398 [Guyanagaster necrorhizus]|uniref:DUF2421 domain-containing protein n=1 Tax=Guyanagaster necrorhizus TaxID=856835 RepID=A0A9P7VI84_9AGAR|nr:uncharacterized protein BT62DRAFT_910398 [Guyanagaster necrorhizus MCA 3950]KAG7440516.1 hypothetical protein BT62DRAFT_910398 [Guyanagaster necrorhizus MCA 3950]